MAADFRPWILVERRVPVIGNRLLGIAQLSVRIRIKTAWLPIARQQFLDLAVCKCTSGARWGPRGASIGQIWQLGREASPYGLLELVLEVPHCSQFEQPSGQQFLKINFRKTLVANLSNMQLHSDGLKWRRMMTDPGPPYVTPVLFFLPFFCLRCAGSTKIPQHFGMSLSLIPARVREDHWSLI